MAVTGLVLAREGVAPPPDALRRRWHRGPATQRTAQRGGASHSGPRAQAPLAAAFWRPAVATLSLDDLLRDGHTIVYEPAALAWHRRHIVGDLFHASPASGGQSAIRRIDLADTPRSIADAGGEDALQLD